MGKMPGWGIYSTHIPQFILIWCCKNEGGLWRYRLQEVYSNSQTSILLPKADMVYMEVEVCWFQLISNDRGIKVTIVQYHMIFSCKLAYVEPLCTNYYVLSGFCPTTPKPKWAPLRVLTLRLLVCLDGALSTQILLGSYKHIIRYNLLGGSTPPRAIFY